MHFRLNTYIIAIGILCQNIVRQTDRLTCNVEKHEYVVTDGRTDGRTDRQTYM